MDVKNINDFLDQYEIYKGCDLERYLSPVSPSHQRLFVQIEFNPNKQDMLRIWIVSDTGRLNYFEFQDLDSDFDRLKRRTIPLQLNSVYSTELKGAAYSIRPGGIAHPRQHSTDPFAAFYLVSPAAPYFTLGAFRNTQSSAPASGMEIHLSGSLTEVLIAFN